MILREAVERIQRAFGANGVPSDDIRLRPREIYNKLKTARAEVFAEEKRGRRKLSEQNYTTLTCVPFKKTTAHECGCLPIKGCEYMKSGCKLTFVDDQVIVTSLDPKADNSINFSKTDWESQKYTASNKYTSAAERFYIKNDHIILLGKYFYKTAAVKGIFEDPITAQLCSNCDVDPCTSYLDLDFDIDMELFERVVKKILFETIGISQRLKNDRTNDGQD